MELNTEEITTPPRPAATVVLLRDAGPGLEVLMMKRHGESDAFGGAYVFPGGKLDPDDHAPGLLGRVDAAVDALHAALGEPQLAPETAAALFVAAVRETFEECGILMAHGADAAATEHAMRRARQGLGFGELADELDLRLRIAAMVPWTRWITPRLASVSRKRFDTRFFVAEVSEGAVARHDEREAIDAVWMSPRAALERYWEREIELAPPQIQSLAHLARFSRTADVLAEARDRPPPLIEPEPFEEDGLRVIVYPGDPRHSVQRRAMPGPTRLRHRQGRFEPVSGSFEGLFD
ncbi:MAG TPA: NUDIX hydrolase [Quisquiliibacterium sp.]|nr:NUDIX hydrolase [Quisquiliibacterium sp.]